MKSPSDPQERVNLPESVLTFLRTHIHSVEQLEVLLLLHAEADREWSAEAVDLILRSSVSSIADRLKDLRSRRFLSERKEDGRVLYKFSDDPALKQRVDELKDSYRVFTVRIIEKIYEKKDDPIQSFSKSFRILKK